MNTNELIKGLKNIQNIDKNLVFWSWNGELEKDKLIAQIKDLDEHGFGGFFMHARSGLSTEYLSEKWFDACAVCIEEAKKRGMQAWIYDENGWPSGFVGGKLLNIPEFLAKGLRCEKSIEWDESADYKYIQKDGDFIRVEKPCADEYYNVKVIVSISNVDILNPDCVDAFIKATHEEYYKRFGDEFGKTVVGFFTDEPQFYENETAYSDQLVKYFKENYNEDIIDKLPLLFFDGNGRDTFRYRYWNAMNVMFTENYFKKLYNWCENHNCKLTGHLIDERFFESQMYCCAGVMPSYNYIQLPAVDHLQRYTCNVFLPNQIYSVAKQNGIRQLLTETFAMSGWDVTMQELRWLLESQYVGGLNVNCIHLYPYSMQGVRKHDYPCCFGYFDSWWDEYTKFNEYSSRLGYMLRNSVEKANVALFNNIKTGYLAYQRFDRSSMKESNGSFYRTGRKLSHNHVIYDLLDEYTLKHLKAHVKDGKLVVGECEYEYVVLPDCKTMQQYTANLFKEFVSVGGKLVTSKVTPNMIEGQDADLSFIKGNCTLNQIIDDANFKAVKPNGRVRSTLRRSDFGDFIFVFNNGKMTKESISLKVPNLKDAIRLNLETLEFSAVDYSDGVINMKLAGSESAIILLNTGIGVDKKEIEKTTEFTDFSVTEKGANFVVLDYAKYSLDGVNYTHNYPISYIRDKLMRDQYTGEVYLKLKFNVKDLPNDINFTCCDMRITQVLINGNQITLTQDKTILDEYFGSKITPFVKQGENEIIIKIDYYQRPEVFHALYGEGVSESLWNCLYYDTEIESVYLYGDFSVFSKDEYENKPLYIQTGLDFYIDKPKAINSSDIIGSGMPYYKGEMVFSKKVNLENGEYEFMPEGRFATAKIRINGGEWESVLFGEKTTILANNGINTIDVKVYSGNRNLFGPHHHISGESWSAGAGAFTFSRLWKDNAECKYFAHGKTFFVPFGLDKLTVNKLK